MKAEGGSTETGGGAPHFRLLPSAFRLQTPAPPLRRPPWLKIRLEEGAGFRRVRDAVRTERLATVCEEARCPNRHECWNAGTATIMLLGEVCTRACGFCAVATGRPAPPDPDEPRRVAAAAGRLGLRWLVLTSVDRDDLPDGGAAHWAAVLRAVRATHPAPGLEALTPDFRAQPAALATVFAARPDVFAHNLETVPRLSPLLRKQARHERSLAVLAAAAAAGLAVKTGLLLGLGETTDEVRAVLREAADAGARRLTLGQYLAPTKRHVPVARFVAPEEFQALGDEARALGFTHVESGPLVRSSYHAERAGRLKFQVSGER